MLYNQGTSKTEPRHGPCHSNPSGELTYLFPCPTKEHCQVVTLQVQCCTIVYCVDFLKIELASLIMKPSVGYTVFHSCIAIISFQASKVMEVLFDL